MTAPTPDPSLEDTRRETIKTLLDMKGQSVMDLLFRYGAWANQQTKSIKLDYGNLSAWLRGTPRRLSEQKQLAFASFLGLREDQLQKGIVHSWQPTLSAFALQKHMETIKCWFGREPVMLWEIGLRPEQQQTVRIVQMKEHLVRISAVDSVWALLLPAMGVQESDIRVLPKDWYGDDLWLSQPLDFDEVNATLLSIGRQEQIQDAEGQTKDAAWQQLIRECDQAGVTPEEARQRIFTSSRDRYGGLLSL